MGAQLGMRPLAPVQDKHATARGQLRSSAQQGRNTLLPWPELE